MTPTAFTAQNGAVIHQNTPISVLGCSTKLSLRHSLRNGAVVLKVYAPAAGRLKLSGKGQQSASRTFKGREEVSITLKLKRKGHFKTRLKVSFAPSKGAQQVKTVTLRG